MSDCLEPPPSTDPRLIHRSIDGSMHLKFAPRSRLSGLARNGIGDEGMKALAPALRKLRSLRMLFLSHNPLGDTGIEHLIGDDPFLPAAQEPPLTLTHLYLDCTRITNMACKTLKAAIDSGRLPELLELAVWDSFATDSARQFLYQALRQSIASRPQSVTDEAAGEVTGAVAGEVADVADAATGEVTGGAVAGELAEHAATGDVTGAVAGEGADAATGLLTGEETTVLGACAKSALYLMVKVFDALVAHPRLLGLGLVLGLAAGAGAGAGAAQLLRRSGD